MSMFYLEKKGQARWRELAKYRFDCLTELTTWQCQAGEISQYPPKDWPQEQTIKLGETWSGRDRYLWVMTELTLPDQPELFLYFDFGKTDGGTNNGFESLLFINQHPYQGVDGNHREVAVSDFRGQRIQIALRLWSGLEGGGQPRVQHHLLKTAELRQRRVAVDQLYYDGSLLNKTIAVLGADDPIRYQLEQTLDLTLAKLDWQEPGSATFFASVQVAADYLHDAYQHFNKTSPVTVTAVGHTHIDVAWLWRTKHTREKAARSFSTVLRLMKEYPDYVFLQTQPQLYQFIKEDYPEIFAQIKDRVREGRWEADGSMWLEADCNIPSGESLTRQILQGKQFFKQEFQQDIHYLWLPDVFGYSWALPQILKKSGIDTFMTTKISWNQYNRMPHDTFNWRGLDGSEVLTHFITTPEPEEDENIEGQWYYTYNGDLEPAALLGLYQHYQDKAINQNLLLAYGFGDGGGGVTRDMLEKSQRLAALPGLPQVKLGTAREYFEQLHQTIAQTPGYVQTWDGELYLEYHRGTYTTHAAVKKTNRKTELLLRRLEILFSLLQMSATAKATYPGQVLHDLWRILLRNQFHDIVPGSAIHEVYQDYQTEFDSLQQQVDQLLASLPQPKSLQVFNYAAWPVTDLVFLPEVDSAATQISDQTGHQLPMVKSAGQTAVLVTVPSFAAATLTTAKTAVVSDPAKPVATILESGLKTARYQVIWNERGQLTSLYQVRQQREVLAAPSNVLQLFEDKPINFDAWNIDIFYQQKCQELSADRIEVIENNQLFVTVQFTYHFDKSTIIQQMRLYQHTDRIDFITKVDWQQRQQLLKAKFAVNVRATEATYDIQYGNVKRPTHWNTSWDYAKFETVGHQWADLSQQDFGVSLLNDCKYGYDIKDNCLRLSLLKGAIFPDPTADLGEHQFTYSLLPHDGDFVAGGTIAAAWQLNDPLQIASVALPDLPQVMIDSKTNVMIDALKQAESGTGWILRLHETIGSEQVIDLKVAGIKQWQETNLMEEPLATKPVTGETLHLKLTPYEIKTFLLR
ncbi:alpha-mannosidase [Lapidilactobacillus wuchangensis]|uniref:alpha-mannosidase n=1 Tax=Lapidilactobacillus wuchangensis TaxID=2486001 RepID=UPI001CDC2495|nr:alpha-mannosidase [Lapidilactobacillus wuchangensis]